MSNSQTRQVRHTIGMLSSMIRAGEQHSYTSEKMVDLAHKAMTDIEQRLGAGQVDAPVMCRWSRAWIGQCKEPATRGEFCDSKIVEIVELGKPKSLVKREGSETDEIIKTDKLVKELNIQLSINPRLIECRSCGNVYRENDFGCTNKKCDRYPFA